eukprot:5180615-Ditylum_brightwellii.AAC.1
MSPSTGMVRIGAACHSLSMMVIPLNSTSAVLMFALDGMHLLQWTVAELSNRTSMARCCIGQAANAMPKCMTSAVNSRSEFVSLPLGLLSNMTACPMLAGHKWCHTSGYIVSDVMNHVLSAPLAAVPQ